MPGSIQHNASVPGAVPNPGSAAKAGPLAGIVAAVAVTAYAAAFLLSESQGLILALLVGGAVAAGLAVRVGAHRAVARSLAAHGRLGDGLAVGMVLALMVIFHDDHYALFLVATILLYVVAVLGLNVQLGFTGLINFSCASFFGIGGYTAAMLGGHTGVPPLVILACGGVTAAVVGSILLLPVLRTSGHYSALVTMAFALLFKVFMEVNDAFGGPQGVDVAPMRLFGWDFSSDVEIGSYTGSFYLPYVLLALALAVGAFVLVRRIERSWIGLSLDAVRVDEVAGACFGIDIRRWKITAFTAGNFLAGVSGALYAMMLAYISPANFTFADSLIFLSILLLGGIGSSWGVVLATAVVVVVPEKFQVIQEYRFIIYSSLVLLMILFRPMGLLPRKVRAYRRQA
ncbi:MAG: branched-chain amino acid ABC transporter permease [Desulfovibrionaceae bacterium]|jgi:ABC-type branched-subunit amino acid transport system permease subunit|nr:branched-chain amino acid ABC transporter permease [Desulfovibrionaceae bacterium]